MVGNESDIVARPAPSRSVELGELERPALEDILEQRGHERFRARQIFRWIYRQGVTTFEGMTDLSHKLRASLAHDFTIATPLIAGREQSIDGTEKFVLRLADGKHVESVFIPDTPAMTFCISTDRKSTRLNSSHLGISY